MTIDERLAAITSSLELLSVNVHALQDAQQAFREQQERLAEQHERLAEMQGRALDAALGGIAEYLRIMRGGNGTQKP
jgi:endonuclease/exonuclease/phosphatase family metal-dependent hydrolase